jgi:hypothetical protein
MGRSEATELDRREADGGGVGRRRSGKRSAGGELGCARWETRESVGDQTEAPLGDGLRFSDFAL